MRRSWFSIIVVSGLLTILIVLAGLQYHWLRQVSEADREKMQKRVEADAARFAEDFNREIHAAYFNFQIDADTWRSDDPAEFNERYEYWKSKTDYPSMVKDFYFFDRSGESAPLRYVPDKQRFEKSETTDELKALRARFIDDKTFRPIYEDVSAMVMPIDDGDKRIERILIRTRKESLPPPLVSLQEKFGYLVVMLNVVVIKEQIFPALTQKYFADGEYNLAVRDQSEQEIFRAGNTPSASDANVSLLNLSPDNFLFFANRDILPRIPDGHKEGIVLKQHLESRTFSRVEAKSGETGTFQIEMRKSGEPKTKIFAGAKTAGDPWTLSVQHRDGSIDAFITNTMRKNMAVGIGLFTLLGAAVILIFLTAQRARMLAQRQIDFVSSVSHEFRTPLAVIYSAGENLADGVTKEESQISRYGTLIKGEGKKLTAMVEQILDFAGSNSGNKKYNFSAIRIDEIVAAAIEECDPLVKDKGFTVEKDIAHDLPPVKGDRDALSRSIQNLIANSVKYGNGAKWLKVSAVNGGRSIKITVEDRGFGIAKGDLRQIFEPFYRVKSVVDAQIHGNGLGLSIVKQIVEEHGGNVSAESEVGKGSRFIIELPL